MIRVKISDNDGEFIFKNVNFIKIDGEDFIINYQDKNDEKCEEIRPIPGDVVVEDGALLLNRLRDLLLVAADRIYRDNSAFRKSYLAFNSITRYAHIMSIEDLLEYDADKIPEIRNVGDTSYDIIMKARCLAKEEK